MAWGRSVEVGMGLLEWKEPGPVWQHRGPGLTMAEALLAGEVHTWQRTLALAEDPLPSQELEPGAGEDGDSSASMAQEPPGNGVHFQWLQGVPKPGCELGGGEQAAAANSASARLLGLKCSGCCSAWGQCQAAQGLQDGTSLYKRFLRLGVWERRQPPRAVLMPEEQQEGSGFVQLVGDNSPCSGRVEIRDGDQWKTVCDSDFGPKAATVVCRELQCGTALSVAGAAHFGEGDGPIWDRELQCVGNESLLASCPRGSPRGEPCSHAKDVGVTCTQFTGFRLVNGSTECEGKVEVQVLGTWGTLCASHWDLSDAHVLCRHLDCGFAESIPRPGHFGRATHPFWRDSFHCDGTEGHLGQCPVTALGALCSHESDASVICSGPADSASLRLVGGGSRCDGRVEILQRGTWGRVLDDQWDVQEASVVCRQLGCGEAEKAYNPPKPQRGMGPVGLRGVRCAGHEANLTLCNTSLPESSPVAGTAEDVGVVCWGSRQVRLVNGPRRCAGRVEVYYQGSWGTICDDGWDLSDATVICHQLGCGRAVQAVGSGRFGEGSGQIWLDGVNCSGAEDSLWDCPAGSWGQHDCGHKEDAGVVCSEFVALRLENSNNCSGHLQVFYNGTWGSVCSNSMTPKTVLLACKELGCGDEGSLETQRPYGRTSGPTWLDHVQCGERNSSFWQCPSAPWDPQSCDDLQDETHITCNGRRPETPPSLGTACPDSTSCTDREKIRAVGGEDGCSGRVEVWHRGSWGTVCDDSWDMRDAEVACRQLGCGPAVSALHEAAFGMGTGPIWLEQVECRGTEPSLQDCWARPGDSGACRHKEDAAVNCSGEQQAWCCLFCVPARADPTRGHPTSSGRVSLPVIICIVLGALLCLLLALLAGQLRSARAGRRGSRRAWEPFPEAVYEEIGYSPAWEKQARFSRSGPAWAMLVEHGRGRGRAAVLGRALGCSPTEEESDMVNFDAYGLGNWNSEHAINT
ncbi:antigen WC1.1-like [Harpia harpyja]|uniref:antigen WC1.1-like n=1 Tax=Harpia harpyja TaxID=202280 RepID=UPI0022B203CF|nr:antigen WC1.1-like [Harpia harpyja]